jgi:hypothetical protein
LRAPRAFTLPAVRRSSPGYWLISLTLHALLLVLLLRAYSGFRSGEIQRAFRLILTLPAEPIGVVAVHAPGPAAAPRVGRPLVTPPAQVAVVTQPPAPAPPTPVGDNAPTGAPAGVAGGAGTGARGPLGLAPNAGDSRLWVRPMYIPEGGGRPISMDSVVRQRLLGMARIADSLARSGADSLAPNSGRYRTPTWVVEHNGKKYGIDQNAIHFGSFSIPTAVLAFLPIPQGNVGAANAYRQQMEWRADILQAAARAEAEYDFRRAVERIRARREKEHEEQQRQRDQQKQQPSDIRP